MRRSTKTAQSPRNGSRLEQQNLADLPYSRPPCKISERDEASDANEATTSTAAATKAYSFKSTRTTDMGASAMFRLGPLTSSGGSWPMAFMLALLNS